VRSQGDETGVYVRIGSTNRRADSDMVAELRRSTLGCAFDEEALPDLGSEAIDFPAASESFAGIRKLKRNDLETLRLLVPHQGRKVPSVGGILLFGTDRLAHFPDAWIQAGRFDGTDKSHIADSASLKGFLPSMVESAIEFVAKHSLRAFQIGALRRDVTSNIPPVTLREALINAVVHTDYSQRGAPIRVSIFDDRLEIENPGILPAGLTVDDMRRGVSKLRNRVIGRVFQELGLVEQWGSGIQRMTASCVAAGLAPPALEEIGTRFRVTIHTQAVRPTILDAVDQAIMDALSDGRGMSTNEIAQLIDRTPRSTRTRLIGLLGQGLVQEVGSGPNDPKRRYFRTNQN